MTEAPFWVMRHVDSDGRKRYWCGDVRWSHEIDARVARFATDTRARQRYVRGWTRNPGRLPGGVEPMEIRPCPDGKVKSFDTEGEALRALLALWRTATYVTTYRPESGVYECRHQECGKWHFTTSS